MLGALIGDIAGSRFERHNIKSKEFVFLTKAGGCRLTDDSVCTLAVAKSILDCRDDFGSLPEKTIDNLRAICRMYPNAGYGGRFYSWFTSADPKPYGSFGNGAAMRVSPCGYAARSVEEAVMLSDAVTNVSHNHPESIKAGRAVASAIFLARSGSSLQEIRAYIREKYYDINFALDEIRSFYAFDVSCQGSVPQAFEALFESTGFEDAVRNAVSIGGDSDTIASITGGMAAALYGIPDDIRERALTFLDECQADILRRFEVAYGR